MKQLITKSNIVKFFKTTIFQSFALSFAILGVVSVYALTYPSSTPTGELNGGSIGNRLTAIETNNTILKTRIDNMSVGCTGGTITGYSANGTPICGAGGTASTASTATTNNSSTSTTNNNTTATATATIPAFVPTSVTLRGPQLVGVYKGKVGVLSLDGAAYKWAYNLSTNIQYDKIIHGSPWHNNRPRFEYEIPITTDNNYNRRINVSTIAYKYQSKYSYITITGVVNGINTTCYDDAKTGNNQGPYTGACNFTVPKGQTAFIRVRHGADPTDANVVTPAGQESQVFGPSSAEMTDLVKNPGFYEPSITYSVTKQ